MAEVRITRLAAGVFYATILVDGSAGGQEIDARPSEAVNLAVLTGAPIRVASGLLEDLDAQAVGHPHWQDMPPATAQIAAEASQQLRWRR